jgi:hypothetical protein
MKRLGLIVTLLLLFQSAAFAIGPAYSGSWFNPDQSGHGFSLEYSVLSGGTPLVVVYWYVYDTEGNPIFLIGVGEPEEGNTVTLEFEAPYGMKFGEFDPESTVRADGGTGALTFEDSESGVFNYEPSQWMKDTYAVLAVSIPVVKLLGVEHPNPEIIELHIGARFLTTTERTGDFPVCFNGDGELLPCADDVEPPPVGDPYVGAWTGRMTYDRNSTGTCHDADVLISVSSFNSALHKIDSLTVIRDSGGLDNVGGLGHIQSETGTTTGYFEMFDLDWLSRTNYTLQFNTQGSAQGYWNYENGDCYGEWTFTKD